MRTTGLRGVRAIRTQGIALLAVLAVVFALPALAQDEGAPETTPPRLRLLEGDVSFTRPGADEWAPAVLNTPLSPGDTLYSTAGAKCEVQIGARAFVRAGTETEVGIQNQEPDFVQLKGEPASARRQRRP